MVAFSSGAVLTAAALNTAFNALTVNAQTGTTYTFVLTDHGGLVTANNASASTYTVPPNASVAFATGDWIEVLNIGAGTVTLSPGSGVTINGGLSIPANSRAKLIKQATNTWYSTVTGGASGLVLIGTYSPSASSSFSIDSCFGSAYDVHIIECQLTTAVGAGVALAARMRASATDNSAASYDYSLLIDNPTSPASSLTTGQTSIALCKVSTTLSLATITVAKAASATATAFQSHYMAGITSPVQGFYAGGHNVATAYDGITFIPASSSISGTIRVYGLAQ